MNFETKKEPASPNAMLLASEFTGSYLYLVYAVRYAVEIFGLLAAVEAAELTDHAAADAYRHIWRDIAVSVSYVGILAVQCDLYRRQYHIRLVFLSSLYIFLSFGRGDVAADDCDLYVFH